MSIAKDFHPTSALTCVRTHKTLEDAERVAFFRTLLDVWRSKKPTEGLPRKTDMQPYDFPKLLPYILIVDIERDPLRFVYRLSGTRADTIHGSTLRGVYIDTLNPPSFRENLLADMTRMVEDHRPQFVDQTFTNVEGNIRDMHVLRLPLADDDGLLAHILILSDHGADMR